MAEVEYEYQIVHEPSGTALTKRYVNLGNALNRIESNRRRDWTPEYLADCIIREYRIETTVDVERPLDDAYEIPPGDTAYVRTFEKRPCTNCNGKPPNGFECKKCKNTGEMDVAVAKPISITHHFRKSGSRYKQWKKKSGYRNSTTVNPDDIYATPEEAEDV